MSKIAEINNQMSEEEKEVMTEALKGYKEYIEELKREIEEGE